MPRIHKSDLEDNIPAFIHERIPKAVVKTVIDAGANIGWMTIEFLNQFPAARVWSFEPVPSIYNSLRANVARHADISRATLIPKALGSHDHTAKITIMPEVTVNKIVEDSEHPVVDVEVTTVDGFCSVNGIDHVDFLKIDVEGHDMKVLVGAGEMLSRGLIDFVQVEAGMSDDNLEHIHFRCFEGFLKPLGYRVLTIKNQASLDVPYLTWADVVFIREAAAKAYA